MLQREQLAAWFAAVQKPPNPIIAACLQMMLLTGARPGEVLALRWEDVNTQWKGLCIRDKVEGTREIAATPYMLHLLEALLAALRHIAEAHGMSAVAARAGIPRKSLCRALSPKGNPTIKTFLAVVRGAGLRLAVSREPLAA